MQQKHQRHWPWALRKGLKAVEWVLKARNKESRRRRVILVFDLM